MINEVLLIENVESNDKNSKLSECELAKSE